MNNSFDLCVIGAGSGGIGAAITASMLGLKTALIEKYACIGGVSADGGVHSWEVSAGGTGIPFDIYLRLREFQNAVGITSINRHCCFKPPLNNYPGAELVIDNFQTYPNTLQRCGTKGLRDSEELCRKQWHAVVFEPEAIKETVLSMLRETNNCTLFLNCFPIAVDTEQRRIKSIKLSNDAILTAPLWIDATGDISFSRMCGCGVMHGRDAKSTFNEPSAPDTALPIQTNGITRIYRITPSPYSEVEPLPSDIPRKCWWRKNFPLMSCFEYPCGDKNCNMLPTIEGDEFVSLSLPEAMTETRRRVLAHWCYIQSEWPEFRSYKLKWIAPLPGIRESFRLKAEYILTEYDITEGISNQKHGDIIAINDHPCDRHGANGGIHSELAQPYGIPYRCLIPKGFRNLLVACRGAGFSSIAASSCRLSRTMMQLGQAAGTAAFIARNSSCDFTEISVSQLQYLLREQHVQLDWPMPEELKSYLKNKI